MKTSDTVEIRKHGNTYEDITFCPECGGKENSVIDDGEYGDYRLIFEIYGDGKVYKCKDCGCEYLICKSDKIAFRKFKGFCKGYVHLTWNFICSYKHYYDTLYNYSICEYDFCWR